MAQNGPPSDFFESDVNEGLPDLDELIEDLGYAEELNRYAPDNTPQGPSLPIILLSTASAIAGFIVALYLAYREFAFRIEISAAIATFFASAVLGITGATLSAITGARSAVSNIAFSCGLILISVLFFGLCLLVGAFGALLLLLISGM